MLMSGADSDPSCSPDYLSDGYPWVGLGQQATVVEIGGGYGHISIVFARRYPSLRCVVQDRPEIVAAGFRAAPGRIGSGRGTFMSHDFFTEQPVRGADVYLLRWISRRLGSDKYAIKTLRALVPALKPGARIIVNEAVVPEPGVQSPFDERLIRDFDMTMWHYQNEKEARGRRTEEVVPGCGHHVRLG
jgi:hypothetical protein